MLFFLDEACLCEFALQLAKDFLLTQTLPPELNERVHLLILGDGFDALGALAVELIYQHLNESSHVRDASEGGRV